MRKIISLFALAGIILIGKNNCSAQNITDLRINEVMLKNNTSYVDNYGRRSAWVEIMNTGYNSVNAGSCFLTNDINNPRKYRIPYGDPVTNISKRQFLIFYADATSQHGTLHLNFLLDSTNRFIALFSPDGRTLIDSVTVPNLATDFVYSRESDGTGEWIVTDVATPNATNELFNKKVSAAERFIKVDPTGIIMTVTAMLVVFTALLILYRIFKFTGKVSQKPVRLRKNGKGSKEMELESSEEIPGEVFAAISTALFLYENEVHDHESTTLTIERVSRRYSPWSSKIYGLRQTPNHVVTRKPKL